MSAEIIHTRTLAHQHMAYWRVTILSIRTLITREEKYASPPRVFKLLLNAQDVAGVNVFGTRISG